VKKSAALALLILLLFSFSAYARQLDWPEGWSAEEEIAKFNIYSTEYSVAKDESNERFYIAGIDGPRRNMRVEVIGICYGEESEDPFKFSTSPQYFVQSPLIFSDELGRLHLFWVEEKERRRYLQQKILSPKGDILEEKMTIWSTPRRISGLQGKAGEDGRVHLLWTGLGELGLEIFYARTLPDGGLEKGPVEMTSSEKFSHSGQVVIDSRDQLHLFWIEIYPTVAVLQYQVFDQEGNPLSSKETVGQVSVVDASGFPMIETSIALEIDEDDTIFVVWNALISEPGLFRTGSNIFFASLKNGEFLTEPTSLTGWGIEAFNIDIAVDTEGMHLVWEDRFRTPVRVNYVPIDEQGNFKQEPLVLNIKTISAFSPKIFLDPDGNSHVFWYNYFEERGRIELITINQRDPEMPFLSYYLGLGTQQPFLRVSYVLTLNLFLAILNSISQLHFLVAILVILYALSRFMHLKTYTWELVLCGYALIFLLQETGWYYQPQIVPPGLEYLAAFLAGLFGILFIRSFRDWPGIKDVLGQFIVFYIFIYWYTFFTFIPHYILEITP